MSTRIDVDEQAIEELKQTAEYQALGIVGRWRLLCERIPGLEERHALRTARHLERVLFGRALSPDPDAEPEASGQR